LEVNLRLSAYGSGHGEGANFCLADGATRWISASINLLSLRALATKQGEEVLSHE
jgi:prepilin-type processing-associated H-X9-DG protein